MTFFSGKSKFFGKNFRKINQNLVDLFEVFGTSQFVSSSWLFLRALAHTLGLFSLLAMSRFFAETITEMTSFDWTTIDK